MVRDDSERFHAISITGGPEGHRVEILKDGERMKGVSAFKLTGKVDDALRLETTQFVRVHATFSAEHSHAVKIDVIKPLEMGEASVGDEVLVTSTADTIWEALYDCARQLELAAKGSVHWTET